MTCLVEGAKQTIQGLDDPDDAVFVHLALQAEADYLLSGDSHLLALRELGSPVEILSPAEFIDRLGLENG